MKNVNVSQHIEHGCTHCTDCKSFSKLLSIQIPTVVGREAPFKKLYAFIEKQCEPYKDLIEIISIKDNKTISIGQKRQRLYEMANGLYSWQIDDDDWIADNAIDLIMGVIREGNDCITFMEQCLFNGKPNGKSNFSIQYKEWADNVGGFDHVRTPFHKSPIKTKLCLQAGVKDMRYGEDHQFSKDILPLLNTESHIDEII